MTTLYSPFFGLGQWLIFFVLDLPFNNFNATLTTIVYLHIVQFQGAFAVVMQRILECSFILVFWRAGLLDISAFRTHTDGSRVCTIDFCNKTLK